MTDLEAKTEIAKQLSDLLNILNMFETEFQTEISVVLNKDKDVSFEISDPILINGIKDYVLRKAKQLDAQFKLTGF